MHFHVEREGEMEDFYLLRVDGEKVYADRNHPLAGVTIGFDATILAVREARPDEIEHGHPHVDGHHHH
jgi:FKBP-type peptidyl-prolyl cis-trans isomerase SlyD